MKKLLLLSSFLYFTAVASPTLATDCTTVPSCASLGYVDITSVSCDDGTFIKCPLDANYGICIKNPSEDVCAQQGYTYDCDSLFCNPKNYKKRGYCPEDMTKCGCTEEMTAAEKCRVDGFDTSISPLCQNVDAKVEVKCDHGEYFKCRDRKTADLAEFATKCSGYNTMDNKFPGGTICTGVTELKLCSNTPDGDGAVYYINDSGQHSVRVYYKCGPMSVGGSTPADQNTTYTNSCLNKGYTYSCGVDEIPQSTDYCENVADGPRFYKVPCRPKPIDCPSGSTPNMYGCCGAVGEGGVKYTTTSTDGEHTCYICCTMYRSSVIPDLPIECDRENNNIIDDGAPAWCYGYINLGGGGSGGAGGAMIPTPTIPDNFNNKPTNNNCFVEYCQGSMQ